MTDNKPVISMEVDRIAFILTRGGWPEAVGEENEKYALLRSIARNISTMKKLYVMSFRSGWRKKSFRESWRSISKTHLPKRWCLMKRRKPRMIRERKQISF